MKKKKNIVAAVLALFLLIWVFGAPKQALAVPAEKITLNRSILRLYAGQEYQLTANLEPAGSDPITYLSSNQGNVTVSEDGVVKAVNAGYAVITARSASGATASCDVTVFSGTSPDDLLLESENVKLTVGDSKVLHVKVIPNVQNVSQTVYYTSSDPKVATVDGDGRITAVSQGVAAILVETSSSTVCKTCVVKVEDTIEETAPVQFRGMLVDGQGSPLSHASLRLQYHGKALDTVTDQKGSFQFLSIEPGEYVLCLLEGDTEKKIAASGNLLVTGGDVITTAVVHGVDLDVEYRSTQTQSQPVDSREKTLNEIILSKSTVTLTEGQTYQMTLETDPIGMDLPGMKVISSNPQIASVDESGLITGLNAGVAIIHFQTVDGKFDKTSTVTVTEVESNDFSLLIVLIEIVFLIAIVICFSLMYHSFNQRKRKKEFKRSQANGKKEIKK